MNICVSEVCVCMYVRIYVVCTWTCVSEVCVCMYVCIYVVWYMDICVSEVCVCIYVYSMVHGHVCE